MPELWQVHGHAWAVAAAGKVIALDAPPAGAAALDQPIDALWLTTAHPWHFDLVRLAPLGRGTRIVVDPAFPRLESEVVEMLNFGVHRLSEPSLRLGAIHLERLGDCIRVCAEGERAVIHRHGRRAGQRGHDLAMDEAVCVKPGVRQEFRGRAFTATGETGLIRSSADPGPVLRPFPSDREQRAALAEVELGLQRLGTRLGTLLAAEADQQLAAAAAAAAGLSVVIRGGPGDHNFAFRFNLSNYEFMPVPLLPGTRLGGNVLELHLQDYWGMLQGNILAWQLAEAGATATPDAITDTGAGFLEVWAVLHESRFEGDAVGAYYNDQANALLNEASVEIMSQWAES